MNFLDLLPELLKIILDYLNNEDLYASISTCSKLYLISEDILIERKLWRKLNKLIPKGKIHEIDQILMNPKLKRIKPSVFKEIISFGNLESFLKVARDKRTRFSPKHLAEALHDNNILLVDIILNSKTVSPNNPKVLELIKPIDYGYQIGHRIIEIIVEDSRTTLRSRRQYESLFLYSWVGDRKIYQNQFIEFDQYKYEFSDDHLRYCADGLFSIDDFLVILNHESLIAWRNVYLKHFVRPRADDILIFAYMRPSVEDFSDFAMRRINNLNSEEKRIIMAEIQCWLDDKYDDYDDRRCYIPILENLISITSSSSYP